MDTSIMNGEIIVNFGWIGPSRWHEGWSRGGLDIGTVDLIFKNAKTNVSVHIPENISPSTIKKLSFRCRKDTPLAQETHPNFLKVTIEQIRNLTIKAGIFEESPNKGSATFDNFGRITQEKRLLRSDREIKLEIPQELEIGQTYSLVVTSNDFSFSASLLKSDQQMHPEIRKPDTKPSETPLDLDKLDVAELQSRFEKAFIKDKEFESQRTRVATTGNIQALTKIIGDELVNSQLLIKLAKALEGKGVKAQIPQFENFQFAADQSAQAHSEALKNFEQECKTQ